jgi:two-component system chemotaxis response regulator CheB
VSSRTRVLVIDDSPATRQLCADRLARESDFEMLGHVGDAATALRRIKHDSPDVLIVDLELPRTNGLALLKQIMQERPTPVIVYSSLLGRNADLGIAAMSLGAIASVRKPQTTLLSSLQETGLKLSAAIREAARARFRQRTAAPINASGLTGASLVPASRAPVGHVPAPLRPGHSVSSHALAKPPGVTAPENDGMRSKNSADSMLAAARAGQRAAPGGDRIIAIGASTGGTQAIEAVLTRLPIDTLGVVIVQHMPERFTTMFAHRLDELCRLEVREARHGDKVQVGRVLIAPGGRHMMLRRAGSGYTVDVADGPLVNRHKPSVDLLFRSVAQAAGSSALGILMTGMGDDGARGMKEMHDAGARTVAQDEASCVVFGMPKVAIALGGVDTVIALDRIPAEIGGFT